MDNKIYIYIYFYISTQLYLNVKDNRSDDDAS